VLALGGGFLWRFASVSHPATTQDSAAVTKVPAVTIPEKSIAVLPFENLSRDPDNAFFTDGVQDEILTDLAKVADLKVISRTSVMQYRDAASRNSRKIGEELGVAHLLEGSVQRAEGKVRVNAQLIVSAARYEIVFNGRLGPYRANEAAQCLQSCAEVRACV
jgi:TolB-like protein